MRYKASDGGRVTKRKEESGTTDKDQGGRDATPSYATSARNPDMHAVLKSTTTPVLACSTPWRLNSLCRDAGMYVMMRLPRSDNNCYRWILGACESQPGNPSRCIVKAENRHPTAAQVPNDYAIQLQQALQPGVDNYWCDMVPTSCKNAEITAPCLHTSAGTRTVRTTPARTVTTMMTTTV